LRILFEQGTLVPLRRYLLAHTVATAFEMGWAEFSNGNLLFAAEAQFELLVTTDQNLSYQQNLGNRMLAIRLVEISFFGPCRNIFDRFKRKKVDGFERTVDTG
jgi:hypothetical protein